MRLFYAVEVPSTLELRRVLERFRNMKGVKATDPRSLHITLRFLGDVDVSLTEELCQLLPGAVEGCVPFPLVLRSIGSFPGPDRPRVVWADIDDDGALAEVAERIEEGLHALGIPKEGRSFHPHLTLARVKRPTVGLMERVSDLEDGEFVRMEVEEVKLISSELTKDGAIHRSVCSSLNHNG